MQIGKDSPQRHGSTEQRLLEIGFCRTQNPISSNDLSLENKGEMIEPIKFPVFLQDTTEFVKFVRSVPLISNLTNPPLVFPPCLRGCSFFLIWVAGIARIRTE